MSGVGGGRITETAALYAPGRVDWTLTRDPVLRHAFAHGAPRLGRQRLGIARVPLALRTALSDSDCTASKQQSSTHE